MTRDVVLILDPYRPNIVFRIDGSWDGVAALIACGHACFKYASYQQCCTCAGERPPATADCAVCEWRKASRT